MADAAKAADKPAEAPDAAKELERLEEDDEFEEFETEGATSCQGVSALWRARARAGGREAAGAACWARGRGC